MTQTDDLRAAAEDLHAIGRAFVTMETKLVTVRADAFDRLRAALAAHPEPDAAPRGIGHAGIMPGRDGVMRDAWGREHPAPTPPALTVPCRAQQVDGRCDRMHDAWGRHVELTVTREQTRAVGRAAMTAQEWIPYDNDLTTDGIADLVGKAAVEALGVTVADSPEVDRDRFVPRSTDLGHMIHGDVDRGACAYTFPLPSWAGQDQMDPCACDLPAGHDEPHACSHTRGGDRG